VRRIRGTLPTTEAAARFLSRNPTPAEHALWQQLREGRLDGLRFRRQHPLGMFILDFVCLERKLIIELDGSSHDERAGYDEARTEHLAALGYRVVRFRNDDVVSDLPRVLSTIRESAREHKPTLPAMERE
jgi:very-short-patch-repair endonuclease